MRFLLPLLFSFSLLSPVKAVEIQNLGGPPPIEGAVKTVEIQNSPGGSVIQFLFQKNGFDVAREEVRIGKDGTYCISACTIFLGAKNVCVYPNAQLGFHSATESSEYGIPKISIVGNMFLTSNYTPRLKRDFYDALNKGAYGYDNHPVFLTGRQMHQFYGYRLCR